VWAHELVLADEVAEHLERLERWLVPPASLRSHVVEGDVPSDGQEPSGRGPPTRVEARRVSPRAHERVLCHVLRGVVIPDDGQGQAEDPALEAADEHQRSVGITGAEAGDEGLVRCVPHALLYWCGRRRGSVEQRSRGQRRPVLPVMNVQSTLTRREADARRFEGVVGDDRPRWGSLVARGLGALAVLAVGAVHLQQYYGPYAAIPTIGTLFVGNFAAATIIGLALLSPLEHVTGRWAGAAVALVTLGGIALSAGSFVMLLISEHTPLFGFQEPGYDPTAIAASRDAEIAAVLLLGASLVSRFATKAPKLRW
jgi:hypothetical protein